jgi:hypothetical protein
MSLHPTSTRDTSQPANSEAQDGLDAASVGSSSEKPRYRDEVTGRTRLPGTCLSKPADYATFDPRPQSMAQPVRLAGRMTSNGYEQENREWFTTLTDKDSEGRRVGRDPMLISPEVLTAAGHGPRRTKSVIGALGDEPVDASVIRHKHLRRHCLSCATTPSEVRRCAIIDCPVWPYRMGRNPHHPQRGRNPFTTKVRDYLDAPRRT